jgi:hypothetical protein
MSKEAKNTGSAGKTPVQSADTKGAAQSSKGGGAATNFLKRTKGGQINAATGKVQPVGGVPAEGGGQKPGKVFCV